MRRKASFIGYMEKQADFQHSIGKLTTAEHYRAALTKLRKYLDGKDLPFSALTSDLMQAFNAWMGADGNTPNTLSFYNRQIRSVYNKAIEENVCKDEKPFRKVFTGVEKTVKRAIPIGKVREIAHLDLTGKPLLDYARDIFMFSFYTRGMSFVDIAFLKKADLHNGMLTYRRHKTGQKLYIKWEKPMADIYGKHRGAPDSPYMLDIIKPGNKEEERRQYLSRQVSLNYQLKAIGEMIGLPMPLTMYVARHSWASACKASNIPISVISEGMGHDSEETTRIYLAQLDTSIVDRANRKIIKQVI